MELFPFTFLINCYLFLRASQVLLVVKNSPTNLGDTRDTGLLPGSGRCPGGGHGNPLQCSCWKIHGQRSLVGYSTCCHKGLDMTEQLSTHTFICKK